MRPWILLRNFELDFEEIRVPLFVDGYQEELAKYSPTLRVPVLLDDELKVWDSLAIMEYVNEKFLSGSALPENIKTKALCRSYCAEMHSGFFALRNELPMNIKAKRKLDFSNDVIDECKRIDSLWANARKQYSADGEYLFGQFSLADCMFAPVAMRFVTYGVALTDSSQAYLESLLSNAAIKQWCSEAKNEAEIIEIAEIGQEI
ncbi:MAG: glutathione S-transferase [Pseudomonadales bacterium]|nr:glutathione S-transferase [Pseudomonadales bacterium]